MEDQPLDFFLCLRVGDHPVILPAPYSDVQCFLQIRRTSAGQTPCFLRTKKCNKARSLPTCQQPRRCSTVSVLPRGLMSPEEQCPSTLSLLTNCSQEPYPCSKVCHLAQDWEVNRAGTCLGALSSGKICPVFATTCPPVLAASCLCLPKFSSPWEVVAVLWP